MADCPHGFPSPASCFECMEDGNFVPGQFPTSTRSDDIGDVEVIGTFEAHLDGHCRFCPDPIVPGQRIARLDTSPNSYAHEACVPGGATPSPWATRGGR